MGRRRKIPANTTDTQIQAAVTAEIVAEAAAPSPEPEAAGEPRGYPPLRLWPDPELAVVCAPTKHGPDTDRILAEMIAACVAEGGIGLAAPQIGYPLRLVVIKTAQHGWLRLVNPRIVARSGIRVPTDERCLSVPGFVGRRMRNWSVQVRVELPGGKGRTYSFKQTESACAQHELDHLDGRTIADTTDGARN